MADFLVALGLVLVLEGLLFAAFPGIAKRAMAKRAAETPDNVAANRRHRVGGDRRRADLADARLNRVSAAIPSPIRRQFVAGRERPDFRPNRNPTRRGRPCVHARTGAVSLQNSRRFDCHGRLICPTLPGSLPPSRDRHARGAAIVLPALSAPAQARGPESIADVAENVIDAVVNISTSQVEARKPAAHAAGSARLAVRGILRGILQEPARAAGGDQNRALAAPGQFARLRLRHRCRRYRGHQQPRDRRGRRKSRHLQRRHAPEGGSDRPGSEDRSRAAARSSPTSRSRR